MNENSLTRRLNAPLGSPEFESALAEVTATVKALNEAIARTAEDDDE